MTHPSMPVRELAVAPGPSLQHRHPSVKLPCYPGCETHQSHLIPKVLVSISWAIFFSSLFSPPPSPSGISLCSGTRGGEVRGEFTHSQLSVLSKSFSFHFCYKSSKFFKGFRLLEKKTKEEDISASYSATSLPWGNEHNRLHKTQLNTRQKYFIAVTALASPGTSTCWTPALC